MKAKVLLLLFLVAQTYAFSQEVAWVYFKDKENVDESIKNPISILTQRAIDRKAKYGVKIDERDVPVNEKYISKVNSQSGVQVKAKSKWMNCVTVIGTKSSIDAVKGLDFVKEIEYADRSFNVKKNVNLKRDKFAIEAVQEAPQDFIVTDFDYGKAANQVKMINVHKLHERGFTGEGMLIAVIDDGFNKVNSVKGFKRIRDAGKILGTYDFVKRTEQVYSVGGHGTNVLSDIAGFVDGDFAGTAPDASFYLFRTEDNRSETPAEEGYWVEATERADSLGVDVTNSSLGYYKYDNAKHTYKKSEMDGKTTFAARGANLATEKGLLSVVAAGNEGTSAWKIVATPGDAMGAYTVGAVDARRTIASFSSRGSSAQATQKPDGMAQGSGIYVINTNGSIGTSQGTSFASPIMCGAIASLWQGLPHLNNKEIMQAVREVSDKFKNPNYNYGYGIPDFDKALTLSNDKFKQVSKNVRVFPNPTNSKITFKFSEGNTLATAELYNVLGKKVRQFTISRNNQTFDVSDLSSGIYLVKINADNTSKTIKLVKQ